LGANHAYFQCFGHNDTGNFDHRSIVAHLETPFQPATAPIQKTHGNYTPQQVRQSIQAGSYSTAYDCYALAMYCNQEDFTTFHQSIGESCNYEKMRNEINNSLTFHNQTFNATDMIDFGTNADNHSSYDHHLSSSLDYGNHSSHSIDSSNGYDCSSGYDGGGGNCG
jgi:hypothetical protein